MSTQLKGGPHDGLRWNGPLDPTIFVEDYQGRTSVYHFRPSDGCYWWHEHWTPPLFDDAPQKRPN